MTPNENDELSAWLIREGLHGRHEGELIADFCLRLNETGFELEQAVLFLDILHPVLESRGYYWSAAGQDGSQLRNFGRPETEDNAEQWRSSPFFHMQERGLAELHLPLFAFDTPVFSILDEMREAGHTDYFVMIHPMSGTDVIGEMDSLYSRWSTKKPGGFEDRDLDDLRRLVPALALCVKSAAIRAVTGSLVEIYLGRDAGLRVVSGKIERGRVESIHTVLWFSDMRNYTAMSEAIESDELITMLDDYAEAVITSVHGHGGDVLKLIGDGVLAIFNQTDAAKAAAACLSAWEDLTERLGHLNKRRRFEGKLVTTIHVGLHVGQVFYGNVGSDERLDFTVIGPAVNEASRIVATCRALDRGLVISEEFYRLLPGKNAADFADLGPRQLKGVRDAMRLYAFD